MGKMEQTIKFEIIRLAKKQLKYSTVLIARDVRRLKRAMAELRRIVTPMKSLGAELLAQRTAERAKLEPPAQEVEAARISPRLIKKLREKFDISQTDLATLVGVSAGAVGFWEQGKARPGGRNKAALVALRKLGKREVGKILADKVKAAKAARKKPRKMRKARKVSKARKVRKVRKTRK